MVVTNLHAHEGGIDTDEENLEWLGNNILESFDFLLTPDNCGFVVFTWWGYLIHHFDNSRG